ncbi:DNA ligase [Thiocapsa rosea]|uniref:DNA ligase-1 n=1 Tax=Thiocapsa rosea TaxID=69360 RepID=A0A495V612_9GAMM|nr:DNA ligase [Thiocapsa rosea]RKT44043.1 DNA ligase-1 [Thiocapsa rosea]
MPHRSSFRWGLSLLLFGLLHGPAAATSEEAIASGDVSSATRVPAGASTTTRTVPGLALGEVYRPGVDLGAYLLSEKLDGVRGYWNGRRLITRGGMPITAPAWFTADFPAVALDGELWMGRGTFALLSGTVRRSVPDEDAWRRVRYMVFDLPDHPGDFETRLNVLRGLVEASPSPFLMLVEQTHVADHDALMAALEQVVAAGGEGLMLHRRDSLYRIGRTADLLKVKPYLEADARVIAHLPGRGRHEGRMGSLLVEEADGTRFRLGTGFSDAERDDPPPEGSVVNFKYHGRTINGLPRFASFLRRVETL